MSAPLEANVCEKLPWRCSAVGTVASVVSG